MAAAEDEDEAAPDFDLHRLWKTLCKRLDAMLHSGLYDWQVEAVRCVCMPACVSSIGLLVTIIVLASVMMRELNRRVLGVRRAACRPALAAAPCCSSRRR